MNWDEPGASPVDDLRDYMRVLRQPTSRAAKQRYAMWEWSHWHWLVCGHGLSFSPEHEVPEWIQCRGCNARMVTATSKPMPVNGVRADKVIVDEWTPARLTYERMRKTDPITRLCIQAIEKGTP